MVDARARGRGREAIVDKQEKREPDDEWRRVEIESHFSRDGKRKEKELWLANQCEACSRGSLLLGEQRISSLYREKIWFYLSSLSTFSLVLLNRLVSHMNRTNRSINIFTS